MGKKLTYNEIKKVDGKNYTQKKIEVNGYEILIDEKFRPTKIHRMILEFLEKMEYARENNINLNLVDYYPLLLIKYFTNIPIPDELEKQIVVYEYLIDNGFFEEIIKSFSKEEIKKTVEHVRNFADNYKQLVNNSDFLQQTAENVLH
jgi:hypothetical protein